MATVNKAFMCAICKRDRLPRSPVVARCGHLFCWRCIYQWMSTSLNNGQNCPVCKCRPSRAELTPIYTSSSTSDGEEDREEPSEDEVRIPERPKAHRLTAAEYAATNRTAASGSQRIYLPMTTALQGVETLALHIVNHYLGDGLWEQQMDARILRESSDRNRETTE
ncbi:hypothetical protein KP509_34G001100 [Ceratopteris richardii]|uniref:RING-type E3 ubiquitin transferase n=1 Tax=Ceratopteris richardii TaxID=49495 RepID=A0A8T2QIA9_CERRI|nr:hypothetical protein KP509_34G001100 [Ceratopteris richardii]